MYQFFPVVVLVEPLSLHFFAIEENSGFCALGGEVGVAFADVTGYSQFKVVLSGGEVFGGLVGVLGCGTQRYELQKRLSPQSQHLCVLDAPCRGSALTTCNERQLTEMLS